MISKYILSVLCLSCFAVTPLVHASNADADIPGDDSASYCQGPTGEAQALPDGMTREGKRLRIDTSRFELTRKDGVVFIESKSQDKAKRQLVFAVSCSCDGGTCNLAISTDRSSVRCSGSSCCTVSVNPVVATK